MRNTPNTESRLGSGWALLVVVAAEFKRALVAEQCYAALKRSNSTEPLSDLPRLVFDEFYAFEGTAGPRRRDTNRTPRRVNCQSTSSARQSTMLAAAPVDALRPARLGAQREDRL
jgi:hypothetical protein